MQPGGERMRVKMNAWHWGYWGPGEDSTHLTAHPSVPSCLCVLPVQEFPHQRGRGSSSSISESGVVHLGIGRSLGVFLRWALQQGDSKIQTYPTGFTWISSTSFPHGDQSDPLMT
jgi:hypothetical protein